MLRDNVFVTGPRDKKHERPVCDIVVNTTSRAGWSACLSPFNLGPCKLYDGAGVSHAKNVENLWQYCKLYACHADERGEPTDAYWRWARAGWSAERAVRYPMGKGAKPLCSLWAGQRLQYIEARKKIYVPHYAAALGATGALQELRRLASKVTVALWDFDGYNFRARGMTLRECLENQSSSFGHAFAVAALLVGDLDEAQCADYVAAGGYGKLLFDGKDIGAA